MNPTADPQTASAARSSHIHYAARLNEAAKQILQTAERINVLSINAMLTARKAGEQARGFWTVASHLSSFQTRVAHELDGLRETIAALVMQAARMQKLQRQQQLWVSVTRTGESGRHAADVATARGQQSLEAAQAALKECQRQLEAQTVKVQKVFAWGNSLSHNAKIEASTSRDHADLLGVVAIEIDRVISETYAALRRMVMEIRA